MVTHPDKVHVRINGLCSNGVEWWLIFEKNGNIWPFLIDIDFPLSCGGSVPFSCWILYLSQCLSSFKFCQIMGIFPCLDKDSLQTIRLGFGIIGKKRGDWKFGRMQIPEKWDGHGSLRVHITLNVIFSAIWVFLSLLQITWSSYQNRSFDVQYSTAARRSYWKWS